MVFQTPPPKFANLLKGRFHTFPFFLLLFPLSSPLMTDSTLAHRSAQRSNTSLILSNNKRSSVSSIFAKFGLRSPTSLSLGLHERQQLPITAIPSTLYEEEDEASNSPQPSEDFKRYELLTEL
jgi:hypothetical protein